jgi:hypothetical protein
MHGGRSDAGTVIEETHKHEYISVPQPPPPPGWMPAPPQNLEVVTDTKVVERRSPSPHHHHHHSNPIIIDAGRPIETSDPVTVGSLALVAPRQGTRDERAIRNEIKALEAEKEALRFERRAERDFRKADRIRRGHRSSETDLVLYEQDTYVRPGEEVTLVKRERISEPEGGVRIEKDRKGRMSITVPKYIR